MKVDWFKLRGFITALFSGPFMLLWFNLGEAFVGWIISWVIVSVLLHYLVSDLWFPLNFIKAFGIGYLVTNISLYIYAIRRYSDC